MWVIISKQRLVRISSPVIITGKHHMEKQHCYITCGVVFVLNSLESVMIIWYLSEIEEQIHVRMVQI